ncbi:MAG: phage terminase small subunit [[Clostridium] scindens]
MPKQRSPDSYRAEELYKSGMKLVEIASQLNVSEGTVRSWKNRYNFGEKSNATLRKNNRNVAKKKHGGQPGNKNAVGHGAPKRNKNAEKFGFFSKYLPEETVSIIQEMPADPLDVLWDQIQIAYAAIIRAQQIMYVRDRDDLTTTQIQEKDGDSVTEERWEVQQAWDKQGNFLKAQARAQSELRSMIRQYKDLAERVGGKQEAIDRLDEILKGVRENAAKQEAE